MEPNSLTGYPAYLIHAVLDKDEPLSKPSMRNNRAVTRASGWLKGSDRSIFTAIFVYEEKDSLRVNVRSNQNGCFHYPAIPKTEISADKLSRLAKIIIANVSKHIESTK